MRYDTPKSTSIDKALKILSSFGPYNQEMGTIEVSQKLGFHKATVSRILLNLARHNFLQQNSRTRKFSLGPAILHLARALNRSLHGNVLHIAKPHIDDLRDRLKETVLLEVLSGENTIIAYLAEGPRPVRLAGTIGDILPVHVAAGAKAILAFLPKDERERYLNGNMTRFTAKTVTEPTVLLEQFEEIKRRGFSFDNQEHDIGINAVGAPIFNNEQKPVAAVVVAGPSQRIKWEKDNSIVAPLKDVAAKISAALYYKL